MIYPHPTLSQRERELPSPFGRRARDEGKECLTHPISVEINKDLNNSDQTFVKT